MTETVNKKPRGSLKVSPELAKEIVVTAKQQGTTSHKLVQEAWDSLKSRTARTMSFRTEQLKSTDIGPGAPEFAWIQRFTNLLQSENSVIISALQKIIEVGELAGERIIVHAAAEGAGVDSDLEAIDREAQQIARDTEELARELEETGRNRKADRKRTGRS